MHPMLQRLVAIVAVSGITTACAFADPCDTLPKDFVFTPVGECGRETLSQDEIRKIVLGELSVPGLPYAGQHVAEDDLPIIQYATKDIDVRDVCRMCQSVCDCWTTARACIDTAAVNKSMPTLVDNVGDWVCGGTPTPLAGHTLACRNSQCVWEAVDPASE